MKSKAPYLLLALLNDAVKGVPKVVIAFGLGTNRGDELHMLVGCASLFPYPCLTSSYHLITSLSVQLPNLEQSGEGWLWVRVLPPAARHEQEGERVKRSPSLCFATTMVCSCTVNGQGRWKRLPPEHPWSTLAQSDSCWQQYVWAR